MLANPDGAVPIALVTDASTTAMGAVLQQWTQNTWQPLAFFSKKMSMAQQKYSVYDRKLLALYEAVKHFRHTLEAWHFMIFTDHKPLQSKLWERLTCRLPARETASATTFSCLEMWWMSVVNCDMKSRWLNCRGVHLLHFWPKADHHCAGLRLMNNYSTPTNNNIYCLSSSGTVSCTCCGIQQ
jgi:hypothetical protein